MTMRENAVHPNVAANRLGIPIADVYARIRSGELEAEKHGNRWIVILPANLHTFRHYQPSRQPRCQDTDRLEQQHQNRDQDDFQ